MPVYRVTDDDFQPLERTSFEAERLLERTDIQRRLRDRPEILEEGLFILAEEYSNWAESNRRIDLLALDREGKLVVVELKRSDQDSSMDLQAIRYAAMVANMTFPQALDAHRVYLSKRRMDEAKAEAWLRGHLTADDDEIDINSEKPRIFLVSASFSKELTTSVMWLNDNGMDITCLKLQPYKSADGLFLESSQVIPLPEASDYLIRLRNREEEVHQRQVASSQVETFPGGERFQEAIRSAQPDQIERLTQLYETALSLQAAGLAELSTRTGSYNTVLRVRFPGSDRGLVNIFKNEGGWGYLQVNVGQFNSRAPKTKERIEEIIGGALGHTFWGLPDGFLDALYDAYREANGQPIHALGSESASENDAENVE